jgi:hypothetical protein
MKDRIVVEVRQHDWMPGFAAYASGSAIEGPAHVILNVGGLLSCVERGSMEPADLPYIVAESLMHEVVHALEDWAGVEFSETRVEELLAKYRATAHPEWEEAPAEVTEFSGLVNRLHDLTAKIEDEEDQAALVYMLALLEEMHEKQNATA